MLLAHNNAETIEVKTDNVNKSQFYFGDNATRNLRGKIIRRIIALKSITGAEKAPSEALLVNSTVFAKAMLVLVSDSKEIINRIALNDYFYPSNNSGFVVKVNRIIDWTKSYIEVPSTTGLSATEAFVFTVFYDDPRDRIVPLQNAQIEAESVEVVTTSITDRTFKFPDEERFVNRKLRRLYYSLQSVGKSGKTAYGTTTMYNSYLVLNIDGKERFYRIMLNSLTPIQQQFENQIEFNGLNVDWAKSYIYVSDTTDLDVNSVWVFTLFFEPRNVRPSSPR